MMSRKQQTMAFVINSIRFVTLFIFSTFCLFNPQEAVAQSRIKLAKNIVYEGEIVNKQPHGRGTLSIVYPNLPNANKVLEISGTFEGNQITDAEVRSDGFRCDGMDSLYFPTITYAVYKKDISLSTEFLASENASDSDTQNIKLTYFFSTRTKRWRLYVLDFPAKIVQAGHEYTLQKVEPHLTSALAGEHLSIKQIK